MFTDEQIQKVENLCQDFKKSYQSNHSEITITPYISFDKSTILIHIYTSTYRDRYDSYFIDTWFLKSPHFIPSFSGNENLASSTNTQVSNFQTKLLNIFKVNSTT